MLKGVNIEIDLHDSTISELHRTVTCLIQQTDIKYLDVSVFFINQTNFDFCDELKRFKEKGINVSSEPTEKRFLLKLKSGEVFSKNYIYKGVSFLKENEAAFVSPEYSFQRIANSLIIATTVNQNRLSNNNNCVIYDNEKILSKNIKTISTSVINDTCVLLKTYHQSFNDLYKASQKTKPLFFQQLYSPIIVNGLSSQKEYNDKKSFISSLKSYVKKLCRGNRFINYLLYYRKYDNQDNIVNYTIKEPYISERIRKELSSLSDINYDYKGFQSMHYYDITSELDASVNKLLPVYKHECHNLNHSHYDYIMILPWIIHGGIDLFAINYLKTIAEINPNKRILVILTDNSRTSLSKSEAGIPESIEILNLSHIINDDDEQSYKNAEYILTSLLVNLNPKIIHIMASKLAYECLINNSELIRQNTNVIFSSYNYLVGEHGDYLGYTVQELPRAYVPGDIITTDNEKSKSIWVEKYGFKAEDIYVHNQLFEIDNLPELTPTTKDGIKILWAAHIRPEKNPGILPSIALALQGDKISIDCYGQFNTDNWKDGKNPIEKGLKNLSYKGSYQNFFNDINLSQYDLFLYTSHSDGLPNVILEAAIAGLPIVASSIGGIPNALGNQAFLVKNTYSTEEFVSQIHNALLDRDSAIANAKELQKILKKRHSKESFKSQIQVMLNRSEYDK